MDRRRAIFDRIKDTKLNKLTIKQGDQNVRLNLKKDLIDPNVEISEKALEMLEAYALKNEINAKQSNLESLNSVITQTKEIAQIESNDAAKDFCQLTKTCSQSQDENLEQAISEKNKENESGVQIAFTENPLITSIEASTQETKETEEDQAKKEHKCRLCKLKISSDRALHEHVSRIHGGKGIFSLQNKKDIFKLNDDTADEEFDSSGIEDLESQDESYLSSNSETKRKKMCKPMLPRPNVAIRVAKVAYYNSKGTLNSQNPFKSSIFKNGGLRGNFFSQERLPLRSCKIKMKISSNLPNDSETNNEFLMNIHEIIKSDYPESNKTVTLQSSRQDSNTSDQIVTEKEIRDFFKSLLDYIPLNSSIRLEDLLKENEFTLNQMAQNNDLDINESVRIIYEIILDTKQFGINLFNLKKETNILLKKKYSKEIKMKELKKLLNILINNYLVLAVGVIQRVYVANEFKKHWVIESFKSLRGRGNKSDEDFSNENHTEDSGTNNDNQDIIAEKQTKEINSNLKNYKPICIIPRPWRYIDGLINRPVLKKMLESIILFLKTNPNASFDIISSHFCPVLQPIMTLELLDMLERLKCVNKLTLKKEKPCDLFSDFNNGSARKLKEDDLDGDEIDNYSLKQSSIFNIKKIFPN